MPQGGVMRRPGFKYIASVKNAGDYTRLIPFKFSETQSYVLEFGNLYFRVYANGGQVYTVDSYTVLLCHFNGENNSKTFTDDGATGHTLTSVGGAKLKTSNSKFGNASCMFDGTDAYITITDHADWSWGSSAWTVDFWMYYDSSTSGDVGLWHQQSDSDNYHACYVYQSGAGAEYIRFQIALSGEQVQYLSGALSDSLQDTWVHIAVTYDGTTLRLFINGALSNSQTYGTAFVNYTGVFQIGRARTSDNSWGYFKGYIDEFRVTKGAARWTAAFVPPTAPYPFASAGGGSAAYEVETTYTEDDLQRLDFAQSADVMYVTHPDYVVRKITRTDHDSWAIANVSFTNAPSAWSANDYPYTVCFFQDRLCFGGCPSKPDTIWMSVTGSYEDFTNSAADDNRVTVTLLAREVNKIQWMAPSRRLLVGTASSEWWVSGTSDQDPITQSSFIARKDSDWGSARIRPVQLGGQTFFIQRMGSTLREMAYDYVDDKYLSADPGIVANHLFQNYEVLEMDYQQVPYNIIWMIRDDGTLLGFTYSKEHNVFGWHRHTTEASGEFESLAVIPGSAEDELWVVVKRIINDSEVRYVERLDPFYYPSIAYYFGVDSGLKGEIGSTTAVSGLDHLEGETVNVFADGAILGDEAVSSGAITLDTASSYVSIGLNYVTDIETLEMPTEDELGATVGLVKRITNVAINLKDTAGGQYGPDSSTLADIPDTTDTALYNGWTSDLEFNEGYDETATVYIRQDEPLPLEVLALNIEYDDEL